MGLPTSFTTTYFSLIFVGKGGHCCEEKPNRSVTGRAEKIVKIKFHEFHYEYEFKTDSKIEED